MNVIRLENALASTRGGGGKRAGKSRNDAIVTDNQVTNILPKYDIARGRQPLVNLASSSTTTPRNPRNYHTTSSSSVRRSALRRGFQASGGPKSYTTTSSDLEHCLILAITSGRGDARGEVGMAAIDLVYPHMILSQISDCNTYTNTLTKIHVFNPVEIVMPDTMCERSISVNNLRQVIQDKFPNIPLTAIPRIHFHDSSGMDRIRTHCAGEFSTVELFVNQKYYALAAAAAVFKYVEYIQHIVYAPKSMRIEFQGSENTTMIDIDSAQSLELVTSEDGSGKCSLLSVLDRSSTPMGHRLLRASVLQPPCDINVIKNRQECVTEFVSNRSFQIVTRPAIKRLYGASRLLSLAVMTSQADSVQAAEKNLNYVLLLKNIMDVIPELRTILESGKAAFFKKVVKDLEDARFERIKEKILRVIHGEARSVMGHTSSNMQRCFAIRSELNDTLDLARQTYCEIIEDMEKLIEGLSEYHKVRLSLSCNASYGYHIEMKVARPRELKLLRVPEGLMEIARERSGGTVRMTTEHMMLMDQQCRKASQELHLMSNVLLNDILNEVREDIGCLLILNDDIGELDLLLSIAQISSIKDYCLPEFGRELQLRESRHPVMDITGREPPISNDVVASTLYNFHIITGPNMSGKSIYLKQIVILQIMAQIGCYVPARSATFRVADRIFSKMCARDNIETNASTFTLEISQSRYILQSITPSSLVVLDELCRGTSLEEGTSIAWAIYERLLRTNAFTFAATHFFYLTRLSDIYKNVKNHYLKTESNVVAEDSMRLVYTHKLQPGVVSIWNYGICLAASTGLPQIIVSRANIYANEIANTIMPAHRHVDDEHHQRSSATHCSVAAAVATTLYDLVAELSLLFNTPKFTVFNVVDVVNRHKIPALITELNNSTHFRKVTMLANKQSQPMEIIDVEQNNIETTPSKRETTTTTTTTTTKSLVIASDDKRATFCAMSNNNNNYSRSSIQVGDYSDDCTHHHRVDECSCGSSTSVVNQANQDPPNNTSSSVMDVSFDVSDTIAASSATNNSFILSRENNTLIIDSTMRHSDESYYSGLISESTYDARKNVRAKEIEIFKTILEGRDFYEDEFFGSSDLPEKMDCDH